MLPTCRGGSFPGTGMAHGPRPVVCFNPQPSQAGPSWSKVGFMSAAGLAGPPTLLLASRLRLGSPFEVELQRLALAHGEAPGNSQSGSQEPISDDSGLHFSFSRGILQRTAVTGAW